MIKYTNLIKTNINTVFDPNKNLYNRNILEHLNTNSIVEDIIRFEAKNEPYHMLRTQAKIFHPNTDDAEWDVNYLIVKNKGTIGRICFGIGGPYCAKNQAEVVYQIFNENYFRKGIMSSAFQIAIKEVFEDGILNNLDSIFGEAKINCDSIKLIIREQNTASRNLAKKCGFVEIPLQGEHHLTVDAILSAADYFANKTKANGQGADF